MDSGHRDSYAYEEGRNANRTHNGHDPERHNPYAPSTWQCEAWKAGWEYEDDDYDD